MKRKIIIPVCILYVLCMTAGCRKYLDAKSNQKLEVPSTVQDLQSLMDYWTRINFNDAYSSEISGDNFYLQAGGFAHLSSYEQNTYTWAKASQFSPGNNNDWVHTYNIVYTANLVLANIDKVQRQDGDEAEWENVKGQAFFLRAKSFLQVAWIWAPAYDEATAATDPGIPLRLDPDFNTTSTRSTVQQTYAQVISDLQQAIPLLPVTPLHVLRPSRPAAYAYMARIYLSMRQYDKALLYADSCLQFNSTLMNYNGGAGVNPAGAWPFAKFNPEVIYDCTWGPPSSILLGLVDTSLYASYQDNDLRKTLFFNAPAQPIGIFKGNYDGANAGSLGGIATDEMYMTRGECYARAGNTLNALQDLNTVLLNRWKTGTFVPIAANNANNALAVILQERRKELIFRNLRWMDIKRLNKEGANILLTRSMNGVLYTLPPNDGRYALAIPEDVIAISGMQQNPR